MSRSSQTPSYEEKLVALLHWAAEHTDDACLVNTILSCTNTKSVLDGRNERGDTALSIAAKCGNKRVSEVLLRRGANSNTKDQVLGSSPSEVATSEVVELLDPSLSDKKCGGNSQPVPLMDKDACDVSCIPDTIEAAKKTLLRLINAQDEHGETALSFAAQEDHAEVVKTLLELGAKPTQTALDNATGDSLEILMPYISAPCLQINNKDELFDMYGQRGTQKARKKKLRLGSKFQTKANNRDHSFKKRKWQERNYWA